MHQIHIATMENKEAIAKIWRKESAMLGALYMGALKERIEKGAVHIAVSGNNILGFVEYRKRRDGMSVVYHIAVEQTARGQGVGQALLNSLSLPIRLKVTSDNTQAIRFYERYGMERVAEDSASTGRKLYVYERLK
jgi:ribosomal protein S18 acetylase RimI-like enzyme